MTWSPPLSSPPPPLPATLSELLPLAVPVTGGRSVTEYELHIFFFSCTTATRTQASKLFFGGNQITLTQLQRRRDSIRFLQQQQQQQHITTFQPF
jgi:hypothetical protein